MADEHDVDDVNEWAKRQLKDGEEEGDEEGNEVLATRLRDVAAKMKTAKVDQALTDEVLSIADDLEADEELNGEPEGEDEDEDAETEAE